ncbi:retention module-containing protein, partial [Aromatoleum diolicum]
MAEAIAVVVAVRGEAFARNAEGKLRPLHAGDTLYEGEVVVTSAGGRVELAMSEGESLAISENQTVKLTSEVSEATRPTRDDAQVTQGTVDQVIRALEQGENLDDLEAPAAGLAGGGGGEGSSFVRLLRISESVEPLEFQFGQESTSVLPLEEPAPIIEEAPALTLAIDIVDAQLNDGDSSSQVTFSFSEAPVGFALSDIVATGGTVTNLQATDNPLIYTATFTATDGFAGTGSVSVANGAYTNAQGNVGAGGSDTVPVDRSNPALALDIVIGQLNDATNTSPVTFTFTEPPVGFTLDDVVATGGTVTNLQPTSDPLVYTATFTANDGFTGTGTVSVGDGTYTDAQGNPGTGDVDTVPVDTANPNLTLDIVIAELNDGENSSPVTFTFSEAPVGFTLDDVVVDGGTVTNLQPTDDPRVYTGTFTATDGFTGTGTVSVADGTYTDAQGNLGTGDSDTVPIDRANPTLPVNIVDEQLNDADSSSQVTFTFSEAPVGFTLDDITAVGGTVSNLQATADPLVYTATFTATDGFTGTASVSVADGTYTDAHGNIGTGGSDTVPVDTAAPTLTVNIVDAALNDADTNSQVTFTFSEPPVGFTADDIVAVGGTVTNLQATADPLVFTATFTAADGFAGTASVSVADALYTDAAGNPGAGGSDTVPVDTAAPTLTVNIVDEQLNDGDSGSQVTFTFSEAPVGFTAGDIVAVGGTVTNLQATADPLVFTATFTATDGFSGTASVSVADNLYTNAAGNLGSGGSDTVPVDRSNPTLTVNIVDPALSDTDTSSQVTFTFSEAPVGFELGDIVAVGGTVTNLQATADPLVFTATFTADDGFSGTASVSVANDLYTDAAGNLGSGGSDTVAVDTANPALTVNIADEQLNDGDSSSQVTFTFSEAPVGFTAGDIVAVGGTVTNLQATANPLVFTATFTATDGFSGTASVSVADNLYTNAAGNLGSGGS